MAAINIHGESPINSNESSTEGLIAAITAAEKEFASMAGCHDSDVDMVADDSSSVYPTPMEDEFEDKRLAKEDGPETKISPTIGESSKLQSPAISPMETVMEDSPLATASTQQTSSSSVVSPTKAPVATDWHAYYSAANKPRRSSSRAHGRNSSISATMDLPWTIDNTSIVC